MDDGPRFDSGTPTIDRRAFLRLGAYSTAAISAGLAAPARALAASPQAAARIPFEWEEATIADLQAAMTSGQLSALALTRAYLERIAAIDHAGPQLNSIIETNPDAEAVAAALDRERAEGHVRGPLHGIPIGLKDNIATDDRMERRRRRRTGPVTRRDPDRLRHIRGKAFGHLARRGRGRRGRPADRERPG